MMTVSPELVSQLKLSDDITIRATWQGGAYIDLARVGAYPVEVINVWDYATDTRTIPFTQKALARKLRSWVKEYGRKELLHDVENNWYPRMGWRKP